MGQTECALVLVSRGGDKKAKDNRGCSPLDDATRAEHWDTADALDT